MKTKLNLSWNDIVFEFKNKDYGAFFLRSIYKKDISIAAGISLLILLLLVGPPFIMAKLNKDNNSKIYNSTTAVLMSIKNKDVVLPPPPPPPPPPPADIKEQAKFRAPIVVDSAKVDIELLTNDQMIDSTTIRKVIEGVIVPVVNTVIDPPMEIPTIVQEMPVFPGGEDAMMKFIKENFKYPTISKENDMDGMLYVSFVVDENGKVVQVEIKRGIDQYIDKEAIRVIKSFPDWSPGRQNGQAVKVKQIIPINLTLTN